MVADRGRGKAGLGGEGAGGDGLEPGHPADEREELLRDSRLRELLVHEQADQEPGRVELLQEIRVAMPGGHI